MTTPPLTDAQLRVLRDIADENPATRHTRSKNIEFIAEVKALIKLGLVRIGPSKFVAGNGYLVTAKGIEAAK